MTEENKQQERTDERVRARLSDILDDLDFEDESRTVELHAPNELYPYPPWASFNPNPFFCLPHHSTPVKGVKTYVFRGKKGERDVTAMIYLTADHIVRVAEEESEQTINECLTQIDQSREQAQSVQTEINQLRTETRELISKLLAA
jgi:hypothetical protein